jgi:chemotaxis protein methyltransferase CheR
VATTLTGEERTVTDLAEQTQIRLLLETIYEKFHYDFRGYSMASVKRRLVQAKEHFGCESIADIQQLVLSDETVISELLAYLTVQVTEMFRDPSYFRAIRERVVPYLRTYPSLKVWVAGCSSGEELYSLAILFREEGIESRTIFYGTDINLDALRKAEAGVYELDRIRQFTENHRLSGATTSLSDYYTAAYGSAIFDKSLRSQMVFSDHSLASDEVFGEVHLISCRNVLIYFDRELQDRALGLFTESLARKGFLGLGSKESLRFSAIADAYDDFVPEERIYQKRGTSDD